MQLNHGMAFDPESLILYGSTVEALYSWTYDADSTSVIGTNTTLVNGMSTSNHITRTLLQSNWSPNYMLISRGSTSNIDPETAILSSGHSQIKAFNLTYRNITTPYNYDTDGLVLGWGLRNSVGVAEQPQTGGIWSVENSADQLSRNGVDVHNNNPGEELNFHGYLNGTKYAAQGSNYGYPYCFAAWAPSELPDNANLTIGSQFAADYPNNTINDTYCASLTTPPRLTFQAHMVCQSSELSSVVLLPGCCFVSIN